MGQINLIQYQIGQGNVCPELTLHFLRLDRAETVVDTLQSALQEVHQIPPLHS